MTAWPWILGGLALIAFVLRVCLDEREYARQWRAEQKRFEAYADELAVRREHKL